MSTTPEQMQAMYAQWSDPARQRQQLQRQQMEQQWAAMQGAYSGAPGAPTQPSAQFMELTPEQYRMQEMQRQQAAFAAQQQTMANAGFPGGASGQGSAADYGVAQQQALAAQQQAMQQQVPNYGMTGPYAATGGFPPGHPMALPAGGQAPAQPVPGAGGTPWDPRMSIEPWQQGGAARPPSPVGGEPMMTTQDMVTMPDGRQLPRQQAMQEGWQKSVRSAAAEPMMTTMPVGQQGDMAQRRQEMQRMQQAQQAQLAQQAQVGQNQQYVPPTGPAIQPGTSNEQWGADQMRQAMEQKWAQQQGAFTGQPGAPRPNMPGLINQMNERERGDLYAGQNLTNEQRQVATANEQAVQKYRAGQNPAAAPATGQKQYAGGAPTLSGAQEQITPKGQQQTFGGPSMPEFMPDQYKAQLDEQMKMQKQQEKQLAAPTV